MSFSVDLRDQKFVLYEMIGIESLLQYDKYRDYDKEMFNMALDLAAKVAEEAAWPTFDKGDREGASLKDGSVRSPACYKNLLSVYKESGLSVVHVPVELGGQGMPLLMDTATREHYAYNMSFNLYTEASIGAANLIANFGNDAQKHMYMEKMYAGEWGGTMVLTEPGAGSDVGALKTRAVKQPDGSYRIYGSKIFISGGDSDLYENIVHAVLARIEGDPAGTEGISIFLVPKYRVGPDGSLGQRNDYVIGSIEHKLGIKGSATCAMSFGDKGECYAELLGEPRQGMRIMFQLMNEARIGMGVQGVGTASLAYLLSLKYAKDRLQGVDLKHLKDPSAPKVPILHHPDVRRMLLWMKSQVEGMRGMVYFCAYAGDKAECLSGDEAKKWRGISEFLIPVIKAYCTDVGFRVTETAVQIYGGYGYSQDYPVEQLLRDLKIGSIYEGANGIQALDLVGRKMTMDKGAPFKNVMALMTETIGKYGKNPMLGELTQGLSAAMEKLGGVATYFAESAAAGKHVHGIVKAYPFLNLVGTTLLGWFHYWAAGLAAEKIGATLAAQKIAPTDRAALEALAKNNSEAAFYLGKLHGATFFIKNVLPETHALAETIKNGDLSLLAISDESFAS